MQNCQSQGNEIVLANVLENVDILKAFSYFVKVIKVTFCYTADKLESGKNIFKSRGKVRENEK